MTAVHRERWVVVLEGLEGPSGRAAAAGHTTPLPTCVRTSGRRQGRAAAAGPAGLARPVAAGKVYAPIGGNLKLTSKLSVTDGTIKEGPSFRKVFLIRLEAGIDYTIRMNGRDHIIDFDPVLVLEGRGQRVGQKRQRPGRGHAELAYRFRL